MSVLANGNLLIKEINVTSQGVGQIISEISKSALEAGNIEYVRRTPVHDEAVFFLAEVGGNFYLTAPYEYKIYLLGNDWSYSGMSHTFGIFRPKEVHASGNDIVVLGGDLISNGVGHKWRETRITMTQDLKLKFVSGDERFEKSNEFTFPYDGVYTPVTVLDVDDDYMTAQVSWRGDVYRYGNNSILATIDGDNFPDTGAGCSMKTLNYKVKYTPNTGEEVIGVSGGDIAEVHPGYKFNSNGELVIGESNDIALVLADGLEYPVVGSDMPISYYQGPTNVYSHIYDDAGLPAYIDWVPAWTAVHLPTVEIVDGVYTAKVIFKQLESKHFEAHPQKSVISNIYLLKGEELGIDDDVFKSLVLYPNPVSDNLLIKSPNHTITSVIINDVMGRMVKKLNNEFGIEEIQFSDLKTGLYFITVSDGNETITKKVYKK